MQFLLSFVVIYMKNCHKYNSKKYRAPDWKQQYTITVYVYMIQEVKLC